MKRGNLTKLKTPHTFRNGRMNEKHIDNTYTPIQSDFHAFENWTKLKTPDNSNCCRSLSKSTWTIAADCFDWLGRKIFFLMLGRCLPAYQTRNNIEEKQSTKRFQWCTGTHTHTVLHQEFVSISLHMHEAWPWLCSFQFISVYRLCSSISRYVFIDVAGFYSESMLALNNGFTVSFPECALHQTARANVSQFFFFSSLHSQMRWLKRFPRNFGIGFWNYAEVSIFRWPLGFTSYIVCLLNTQRSKFGSIRRSLREKSEQIDFIWME